MESDVRYNCPGVTYGVIRGELWCDKERRL